MISIDGWVTFTSNESNTPIGTVQVILAVGTTEQIAKFKISKSLTPCKTFKKLSSDAFPVEERIEVLPNYVNRQPIQLPQPPPSPPPEQDLTNPLLKRTQPQLSDDRQANLAAMLSNFIDNLALKLPERGQEMRLPATTSSTATTQTTNNGLKTDSTTNKNLRPTSELLDELQRALSITPTPAQRSVYPCK